MYRAARIHRSWPILLAYVWSTTVAHAQTSTSPDAEHVTTPPATAVAQASPAAQAAQATRVAPVVAGSALAPERPLLQSIQASSAYWADAWRGWHFYEMPEPEMAIGKLTGKANSNATGKEAIDAQPSSTRNAQEARERPRPPRPAEARARTPELIEFERLQKDLEAFRVIAIMRPTEANVRRYMALEAGVVARASYFADMAQRVAWSTPELDPSVHGRPVNAKALEVFEQRQRDDRAGVVATLGRDHVLFFFFRSDCPYCHAFAPTLRAFEERHGLQVVPVSLDGATVPSYPSARRDNGTASALNVTQVPAVFLAQPFSGAIAPIGFGVLSESQLLERIATVSTPESHAMLPSATRRLALP